MSTQNGTTYGYRLYVRSVGKPLIARNKDGGRITAVGPEWEAVQLSRDAEGVPDGLWCRIAAEEAGLISFATAHAHAATLAASSPLSSRVEFRLEKVRLTYSWKAEGEGFSEPFDFGFDTERSHTFAPEGKAP